MKSALSLDLKTRLTLESDTAADIMSENPISLRGEATVREALALLTDHNYSAAPVIDQAGRPIGVLSRTDLLVHDREKSDYLETRPRSEDLERLRKKTGEKLGEEFHVERVDPTLVRDLMTPTVFSVKPDTPARQVVGELLTLKVHRLFVVDDSGALVGVISPYDILRHLE
jgi:CBS-domain-containing membrane protein